MNRFEVLIAPNMTELTELLNTEQTRHQNVYFTILDIRPCGTGLSALIDRAPVELIETFYNNDEENAYQSVNMS